MLNEACFMMNRGICGAQASVFFCACQQNFKQQGNVTAETGAGSVLIFFAPRHLEKNAGLTPPLTPTPRCH